MSRMLLALSVTKLTWVRDVDLHKIFMGDKAAQDCFKTVVTEDSMIMEEKFQNAVTLPSFHNYLIAVSTKHFTFAFIFTFTLTCLSNLTDPINPNFSTKP
jgi:hypothetical protein